MLNAAKLIFATFLLTSQLADAAPGLEKRQAAATSCHCYNSAQGTDDQAGTEEVCGSFGGVAIGTMIGCNCYCAEGCSEWDFDISCAYYNPALAGECITMQEHVCPWNSE